MSKHFPKLKSLIPFFVFLMISITVRLISIDDALFFTWDQGRDFFAIQQIVEGNMTLIGPTTGLQGLFLGPLWYYLGIPGYLISQGNPYIFCLWYIAVTLSCLPLFWLMGKALFNNRTLAIICAYTLSLVPGSIWGTVRVWNPMVAIPLMTGAYLSFVKAKDSRLFLGLGFFLIGLTLQSEFAYAVFFCPIMFILIPWIRKKFSLTDFLVAIVAVGLTLLPQLLFEFRHDFIMSRSLFSQFTNSSDEYITWSFHFSRRPLQLVDATKALVMSGDWHSLLAYLLVIVSWIVASIRILKIDTQRNIRGLFSRQLLLLMAILPYPFYLIWKGNNGYFFDYYLTSHFIFLVPLGVIGLELIYKKLISSKVPKNQPFLLPVAIGFILAFWYISLLDTTIKPKNDAGLKKMDLAITGLLDWIELDHQSPGVVRIFTPNRETEHYDAILHWKSKELDMPIPHTVKSDAATYWYILIEPDYQTDKRLNQWYAENTLGGVKTRSNQVGVMTLESWQTPGSIVNTIIE
ncbi:hypothetical protein KKF92_00365 [Patescibacteria group bacterium]|nr:hypothetical protein [Patescibacteria group bacterium]